MCMCVCVGGVETMNMKSRMNLYGAIIMGEMSRCRL